MLNLIVKALPGMRTVPEFRLMFSDTVGGRPIAEWRITGTEPLRSFLVGKLGEESASVSRLCAELEANRGTSFLENLRLEPGELKLVLRALEDEQRAAEAAATK